MDDIPIRTILLLAPVAGIMVAEAVHGRVPQRQVRLDGAALAQADPNVIHNQKPAEEMWEFQVDGLLN